MGDLAGHYGAASPPLLATSVSPPSACHQPQSSSLPPAKLTPPPASDFLAAKVCRFVGTLPLYRNFERPFRCLIDGSYEMTKRLRDSKRCDLKPRQLVDGDQTNLKHIWSPFNQLSSRCFFFGVSFFKNLLFFAIPPFSRPFFFLLLPFHTVATSLRVTFLPAFCISTKII